MNNESEPKIRRLAGLLFLMLAASFLYCIVDNIILGAQSPGTTDGLTATTVANVGAILWLIGHGIHGAAVIALPAMVWRRGHIEKRNYVT